MSIRYFRYIIFVILAGIYCHKSFSQVKEKVTHISGDSLVACTRVNVTSWGTVDRNVNGCPDAGPYNIGYKFATRTSANGSYTFNFTPAVDSLTVDISGVSYLDWGKELVRLYVNGQHYRISSGSRLKCDVSAVITSDGDITGCYPCGVSTWGNIIIKGPVTSLTILDSCAWGYGNGVKASVYIHGKSRQMAPVSLGRDTVLCNGETLLLDATAPNTTYLWQDLSTNPTYTVTKEGTYRVTVSDSCGSKSDTIHVRYKNCNCNIQVPNAFTPNHDGRNDRFPPEFTCSFTDYKVEIFNRWGKVIFLSNDPTRSWDGAYKGFLQDPGVYVYVLTYKLGPGDKKTKSGTVLLIR